MCHPLDKEYFKSLDEETEVQNFVENYLEENQLDPEDKFDQAVKFYSEYQYAGETLPEFQAVQAYLLAEIRDMDFDAEGYYDYLQELERY